MSFSRTRLPGFWTFNSTIAPAEFEHIDDYSYAIDGQSGGTYAPSALLTIGGSGVTISGPFNASDAKIISVDTTLTIELGANLQLTGNQIVNTGAAIGVQTGAFITVSSGGTFTGNAGSIVNLAGTNTLSGATTISGALNVTNTITLTSANNINVSPGRSYTRTCGGAIRYNTTIWQPPTALAAAPVTLIQATAVTPGVYTEMVEYRADVPQSSTLFSVVVRVKGSGLLMGLPATLPTVRVIRADVTTGAASVLGTVTDATGTLVDYKLDHDITVPIALSVDRQRYEYLVYVGGDSGSGGVFGTEVSSPRMVYIRGIIGED